MITLSGNSWFDNPTYNYWIELAAFIFLVVLLVKFILTKKFVSRINIIFGAALICGLCDLFLDILSSILIDNYKEVPVGLNNFVAGMFYIFQVIFPALMFTYLVYLSGITFKQKTWLLMFLFPAAAFFIIQLISFFTGIIFEFDYAAADGVIFKHGKLFIIFYIITGFYLLLTLAATFALRKKLEKKQIIIMCVCVSIIVVSIILQLALNGLLLTGIAISVSSWIAFDGMANASEMIDRVTGVFNYNALVTYLESDIKMEKDQYFIVLNVESITPINTTFGIKTGNQVYKQIGNFFKGIDKKKIWLFRIFNSRFVFVCKDEHTQLRAVELIRARFKNPWVVNENKFDLTCSSYYFKSNDNIRTSDEFVEFATSLDNEIKKNANKNFVYIDDTYLEILSRNGKIERALKRAIDDNFKGFEVFYQPIYHIKSEKFTHAEALIRFNDDDLGFVSPGEFIPIAEASGVAHKIDKFVLQTCCTFLREYPQIEHLHINISCAEFFANPAQSFITVVNQNNVDPKRICFEVTETATVKYPEKIASFMNDMVKEGFTFAIDDFGTGYSNLSRVISKSFSIVKLDKVFLSADEKMSTVLTSVIKLFKQLHIPVVIEGVETQEQYLEMQKLGIDYIQGFYFSRPLPKRAFLEFIDKNNQ